MDLPTHFAFGLAIGFVFFGNPEIALLIGIATLLPDLDREYWFIRQKIYTDEQIHRAGLHNVFIMALTYIASPYLSLGVFLHVLQDSFTTVKDRGVEWFYPLTRMVKKGKYDAQGNPQPLDPKEHVYLYQEDPPGLAKLADPDLQDPNRPVPWRRVYGFAQNSHILDRGFLLGSVAIILVWLFVPISLIHATSFVDYLGSNWLLWVVGFGAVVLLFISGELDRKDRGKRLPKYNFIKYPLFGSGLLVFATWLVLFRSEIASNLALINSSLTAIVLGAIFLSVVSVLVILWQVKKDKNATV